MVFDIVVVGVLLVSAIIACLRGFIREMLTIMGVVGGTIAGFLLGPKFAPVVLGWIGGGGENAEKIAGMVSPETMASILAYTIIFIVVVIILSVISHFLSGWARKVGLGALDRTFGVLFGFARGAALVVLLYLPIYMIFDAQTRAGWFGGAARTAEAGAAADTQTRSGGRTYPYVESAAAWVAQFIPAQAVDEARRKAEGTAEKAALDARERLLQLDGLRDGDGEDGENGFPETPPGEGYEREERRDMNELIMDSLNNGNGTRGLND